MQRAHKVIRERLTASLDVWLIVLWLVFACQKVGHNIYDEMAKFVVPSRKEINDSLSRQGSKERDKKSF